MPNIAGLVTLTNAQSAKLIGDLIELKGISITLVRRDVVQAAQTVRLETLASQKQVTVSPGQVYMCDAYILGYKNHPEIADTDVKPGDRFSYDGRAFEVIQIMPGHVDCVQAWLILRG